MLLRSLELDLLIAEPFVVQLDKILRLVVLLVKPFLASEAELARVERFEPGSLALRLALRRNV